MSTPRSRRKKHEEPEEHPNHERWLVTYADMLTLLMVLFIVMFAMSQVDQKKYNALKNGLADGFGSSSSFMKGSDSILEGHLEEASDPELEGTQIFEQLSPEGKAIVTEALHQEKRKNQQESYDAAAKEASRLKEAERKLKAALKKRGLEDDVSTTIDERGLVVSLVSRHVVFRPNIAQLSPRGQKVVDTLAPVLKELGNELRIDGHTNQAAGPPKFYPTDWDLSAARALSVLRRLNESSGIPGGRLSLAAFGHERPLMNPQTPGSQDINKRVDIVVLPNVGQDAQQLLDQAANPRPESTVADDPADRTGEAGQTDTEAGHDADAASAGHEPEGGSE
jgi:chemotaxis protein MotB